jgi:hypothetical protein
MDTMEAIAFYFPYALLRYQDKDPIFHVALLFQHWIDRSNADNQSSEDLMVNYDISCRFDFMTIAILHLRLRLMMQSLFQKFSPSSFKFTKFHMAEHHVHMQERLSLFCQLSTKLVERGHVRSIKNRLRFNNRRNNQSTAKQIIQKVSIYRVWESSGQKEEFSELIRKRKRNNDEENKGHAVLEPKKLTKLLGEGTKINLLSLANKFKIPFDVFSTFLGQEYNEKRAVNDPFWTKLQVRYQLISAAF